MESWNKLKQWTHHPNYFNSYRIRLREYNPNTPATRPFETFCNLKIGKDNSKGTVLFEIVYTKFIHNKKFNIELMFNKFVHYTFNENYCFPIPMDDEAKHYLSSAIKYAVNEIILIYEATKFSSSVCKEIIIEKFTDVDAKNVLSLMTAQPQNFKDN